MDVSNTEVSNMDTLERDRFYRTWDEAAEDVRQQLYPYLTDDAKQALDDRENPTLNLLYELAGYLDRQMDATDGEDIETEEFIGRVQLAIERERGYIA